MANAVMDTGAQMPVVRPDVVEGQSIDNRGSIQITSAFGEHEMGELKDSNMELNDLRHGVVPVSKNLVNDMLICSSDYEVLIENTQMIRNPAKLREPSKKEGIISSTDSKSVCSQEVVTDLLPETQSLLNVPNGDLVAVKINGSNVQTNGQGIKKARGPVNGHEIDILRDTGATIDLVCAKYINPSSFSGENVWVKQPLRPELVCLPLAVVKISGNFGTVQTKAAVCGNHLNQHGRYLLGNKTAELIKGNLVYNFLPVEILNAVQTRSQVKAAREERGIDSGDAKKGKMRL
ncbi:retrovirus-related Pol polyprotein from transposon 297 [Trichonephila clavipes]|nr:retrovirus-related Pol polyprotein from transposon 297 [Trichonephila clavipes]